jgi:hypothetical protein
VADCGADPPAALPGLEVIYHLLVRLFEYDDPIMAPSQRLTLALLGLFGVHTLTYLAVVVLGG